MSYYISELKRISKKKNIKLKELAEQIGLTEAGFHRAIKNNSLRIEKLFKICEVLEVSPAELLKQEVDIIREQQPTYAMDEKEMLKEVLKTVKRIETKLDTPK